LTEQGKDIRDRHHVLELFGCLIDAEGQALPRSQRQQSRRGLTDGFAFVPKAVPHGIGDGCRTGSVGFQSSHQPDKESIAQARLPSSGFSGL